MAVKLRVVGSAYRVVQLPSSSFIDEDCVTVSLNEVAVPLEEYQTLSTTHVLDDRDTVTSSRYSVVMEVELVESSMTV